MTRALSGGGGLREWAWIVQAFGQSVAGEERESAISALFNPLPCLGGWVLVDFQLIGQTAGFPG